MALEHLGPKVTETVTPEPDSVMECKDTENIMPLPIISSHHESETIKICKETLGPWTFFLNI